MQSRRKPILKLISLVLLFVLCFTLIVFPEDSVVNAQSKTIVVPNDYSTIALAISAASNGDTILVKSGVYDGNIKETLVVDKALSIIGENSKNTIINLYPPYDLTWVTMDPYYRYSNSLIIEANGVELKNFTINIISSLGLELIENGDSTQDVVDSIFNIGGDFVISGTENKLINCDINQDGEQPLQSELFVSGGNNLVVGCNVDLTRGLTIEGSDVLVEGNKISNEVTLDNSSNNLIIGNIVVLGAIYLESSNSNVIANNTCLALIIGPYGRTCSDNLAFNNVINGSNNSFFVGGVGLHASVNSRFYGNEISGFEYGISFTSKSKNNTFYRNNLRNNDRNIKNPSEGNFWDNGAEGNYWSDYNGTDNNGDGIGNTPYVIDENNQDNYPLMNAINITTIPEFPSWTILPIILTGLVVVTIYRKKLKNQN